MTEQIVRFSLFLDSPLMQEHDPVRDLTRKAHFVRDEKHGTTLVNQAADDTEYLTHQLRIERGRWLIEEHDFRLHGKRSGNGRPLLLPPDRRLG